MWEVMRATNALGLAAPQIGLPWRIITIDLNPHTPDRFTLINPRIVKRSRSKFSQLEGCLSVPLVRVAISRSTHVTVTGVDEHFEPVTHEASGLLSAALQHEIDHLDGVLFVDRLNRNNRLRLLYEHPKLRPYIQPLPSS